VLQTTVHSRISGFFSGSLRAQRGTPVFSTKFSHSAISAFSAVKRGQDAVEGLIRSDLDPLRSLRLDVDRDAVEGLIRSDQDPSAISASSAVKRGQDAVEGLIPVIWILCDLCVLCG